jgi:hypothetical protein
MAMTIIDRNDPRSQGGRPDPNNDMLSRQQRMNAARVDEREEFQTETVTISTGPKNEKQGVVLRWPRSARIVEHRDDLGNVERRERIWTGGKFVFAVYSDNPEWHKAARDEWEAAGRNAIEKFAAMKGLTITLGPKQEDTNRFNLMAETREPIR